MTRPTKTRPANRIARPRIITRDGISYSALSDRGKQVQKEMLRERRWRTRVPISLLVTFLLSRSATLV